MITKDIKTFIKKYIDTRLDNIISKEQALDEDSIDLKIYDEPIFGISSAHDSKYKEFISEDILGSTFITPKEWLEGAESVLSFFLPFSENVRLSNIEDGKYPSNPWLHARIEGQDLIMNLLKETVQYIENKGYKAIAPITDDRFSANKDIHRKLVYQSTWSERHAAYISGLGTFGLSKGLITRKGIAGRFGSIIMDAKLPPTKRDYRDYDEYCTECGECIKMCPVNAISLEDGKDHIICSKYMDFLVDKYDPYYGCGKCQVSIPCMARIP